MKLVSSLNEPLSNWLKWNAVLAAALYVGVWLDVVLIGYLVVAFIWLMLVSYFFVLYAGKEGTVRSSPVPKPVGLIFDAAVLAVLISCHWYLTSVAYVLTAIVLEAVYRKARPRKNVN
jgi:hypothetical protein